MPVVSIVLPTYNRVGYLKEAVESVLGQTFSDWELIVVDDGSTDESVAWLAAIGDARIRIVAVPHSGRVTSLRNLGIRTATGRWIALLDSDDRWHAAKLERQLALHAANPALVWSYTNREMIDAHGSPITERFVPWKPHMGNVLEEVLELRANIALPTVLIDRATLLELGGFDERWSWAGDYELWLRLAERFPVGVVTEQLADIRSYRSSTAGKPDVNFGLAEMYRTFAERTSNPHLRVIARRRRALYIVAAADMLMRSGDWKRAGTTIAYAMRLRPWAPFVYRAWIRLMSQMAQGGAHPHGTRKD